MCVCLCKLCECYLHTWFFLTFPRGNLISGEVFSYGGKFLEADGDNRKRIVLGDPKAVSCLYLGRRKRKHWGLVATSEFAPTCMWTFLTTHIIIVWPLV